MDVRLNTDERWLIDLAEPDSYRPVHVRLAKTVAMRFIAAMKELHKVQTEIEPYYDAVRERESRAWRKKWEAKQKKKLKKPPLPVCKVTVAPPYPTETERLTRADVLKERKRPAPQVPANLAFLVD
jgi:hypothetical protein